MKLSALPATVFHESGLRAVWRTGPDAWLIILARSCRMFAYGSSSLLLALFFAALDVSDAHIGLFMTLTYVGDILLSLALTLLADRTLGRRRTLQLGSLLMVVSGAAFVYSENYWVLLLAAVVGVVSATGSDFGPFRVIEESILSELTDPKTRADVLVWYVMTASLGSSLGTEMAGRTVQWLHADKGWTLVQAYHVCFGGYMVMGVVNILSSLLLSKRCELKELEKGDAVEAEGLLDDAGMELSSPISLQSPQDTKNRDTEKTQSKFSQISRETRSIMYGLWFLLMVDSLADGMVSMSLTSYYIDRKFPSLSKSTLGDFLGTAYLLCALTTVFAGPLSRRIGLVLTMVLTHIPSSAAVLLFPLPRSVFLTFSLLLVRVGLNNMDQAPRAALIAAVVKPEERTAVMGVTSTLRTLASVVGPSVTGLLAGSDHFWVAFVVGGALRLAYDLGLWAMFVNGGGSGEEDEAGAGRVPVGDEEDY
ncbi:major facilitator superfamily domain-containing protein [Mycena galopus ATCC 62051]|nr:major facilitator superfamily domain-containing protein [Mycena galopus ATCC 62051]